MSTPMQQAVIDTGVGTTAVGANIGVLLLGIEPMFQFLIVFFTLILVLGRIWLMYKDFQDRANRRNRRKTDRSSE